MWITQTITLQKKLDESPEELLSFAINDMRETFNSKAGEIIVPFLIEYPEDQAVITVPRAGDKKKLIDLSEKNVKYFVEELKRRKALLLEEKDNDKNRSVAAVAGRSKAAGSTGAH
jgi:excinuclease ABC subunit C